MNRFQHTGTYKSKPMEPTEKQRERVLDPKHPGINWGMSRKRRHSKQARHRENASKRMEASSNNNRR